MRSSLACARNWLLFSFFMVMGGLALRRIFIHSEQMGSLINCTDVMDVAPIKTAHSMKKIMNIDPEEFVFCNPVALVNFEHEKKERTQYFFEELCGIQPRKLNFNLLLTQIALRAITVNHYVYTYTSKQNFGIPDMVDNTLIGAHKINDYAGYKDVLVKHIATKVVLEKNRVPQKRCRLSALEKLLK